MRIKRQKTNKRHMGVYVNSFGFREPYQILVDGNFFAVALQMRANIRDTLPKILMGTTRAMTTSCVLAELRQLGPDFSGVAINAKRFELRRCNHRTPIPASDCIKDIIGPHNQHRYGVATQELALRSHLRNIPGTPLVYINNSVIILEPPSNATMDKIKEMESAKVKPQAFEVSVLNKAAPVEPEVKRKKKAKGPNPLSIKKKKPDADAPKSSKRKKSEVEESKSTKKIKTDGSPTKQKKKEDGVVQSAEPGE
ncbi:Fcf1-domain-containing protein [Phlyctochytrium arcticum]|nr:Fcf1-domain-containing protein [Phlyctochytrium arcticum]